MDDPRSSMAVLGKKMGVHRSTFSKAIKIDLGFKSFTLKVKHLVTELQKLKRLIHSKRMLSSFKSTGGHIRFFSDENIFTVDKSRNRQNDRWICGDITDVPMVFKSKNPAVIMCLGIMFSNGDIMEPHFFWKGEKANQHIYREVLKQKVKPWMDAMATSSSTYTFQQDSAPCHKSNSVQNWLKENIPHFWDTKT